MKKIKLKKFNVYAYVSQYILLISTGFLWVLMYHAHGEIGSVTRWVFLMLHGLIGVGILFVLGLPFFSLMDLYEYTNKYTDKK